MGLKNLLKTGRWGSVEEGRRSQNHSKATRTHEGANAHMSNRSWSVSYDGEKNLGEVGPVKKYILNYNKLRDRSWQLYMDSDMAKIILTRFCLWIVKNGLRLQLSSVQSIIESSGVQNFDFKSFNRDVEDRFKIWSNSVNSSHSGNESFNQLSQDGLKNAKVGGDVLYVLRVKDGNITVQVIDGAHVLNQFNQVLANGNIIKEGIETDPTGRHVRYHVRTAGGMIPVEAYDPVTRVRMAFMVFGGKYRLDNNRGVPIIAQAIEKITKVDRYTEASVSQAEEVKRVAYVITNNQFSDEQNPLIEDLGEAFGDAESGTSDQLKQFDSGETVAKNIALTTNRQAINLYRGQDLKAVENKNELYYGEFITPNANMICASVGIPPNVAFMLYNDSFSASRAATKDWENTIGFERKDYTDQCLKFIFQAWFYWQVWMGKISAPGYIAAVQNGDFELSESYTHARFVGPNFPHIDPVKEAEAARIKLGTAAAHVPLGNAQDLSEDLMSGDFDTNVERLSEELRQAEELGIFPPATSAAPETNTTTEED